MDTFLKNVYSAKTETKTNRKYEQTNHQYEKNKTKLPKNKISGPDGCTEAFYQKF